MGILDSLTLVAAMDMMSAGIIGLMFILVVVFAVLAKNHWHWSNIVLVILCFLTGTSAIWGMTQVYSKRTKQVKALAKALDDAAKAELKADEAIIGPVSALVYQEGTLRATSEELSRVMAGRGRVWPLGQVTADPNNPQQRVFQFSEIRADGPDIAPLQDVVLFAFVETQVNGQLYPSRYIGSVRVTSETDEQVVIEPVALADEAQFAQPTSSWTLFEKMPLDRRGIFKDAIANLVGENDSPELKAFAASLKDETKELDITQFRQLLMGFPSFLPAEAMGYQPDSVEYEKLIDRYAFDGLSLGKIQNWIDQNSGSRKSLRFEPLPEEVFVKYRFNKKSSKGYKVDAAGSVETDGLFTPLGQAVEPALHAGKEIEFAEGDTILIDQKTADGYQRGEQQMSPFKQDEDVTEVDRIYIRQVRDFPYEFSDLKAQTLKAEDETARISRANQAQQKALTDAEAQIAERSRLLTGLEADQEKLTRDFATISNLQQRRKTEIANERQMISNLESEIEAAYKKLRNIAIAISKKAFAQN